jgi:hypothetical protein
MAVTATNLLAGPASLYAGVFGATEPLDTALNDAPTSPAWRALGGTNDGATMNISQEYYQFEIDQLTMAPESRMTELGITLATNLAEATLENLAQAMNELQAAVVTGTGTKSFEPTVVDSSVSPNYAALILDGHAPAGFRRRVIARKCLSTEGVETAYKKDGMTLFPVTWTLHWVSDSIKPIRCIDGTA